MIVLGLMDPAHRLAWGVDILKLDLEGAPQPIHPGFARNAPDAGDVDAQALFAIRVVSSGPRALRRLIGGNRLPNHTAYSVVLPDEFITACIPCPAFEPGEPVVPDFTHVTMA
ncbi:hypothetical protein D3C73_596320 [compost metagenome]